jgi:hypothetical protein
MLVECQYGRNIEVNLGDLARLAVRLILALLVPSMIILFGDTPIKLASIPILASPWVILFVTMDHCANYVLNHPCQVARAASLVLIFSSFLFCMYLSRANIWMVHLPVLAGLFISFLVWDITMVKYANLSYDEMNEIKGASKFVNLPTLGAVIVTYTFLWIVYCMNAEISLWAGEREHLIMLARGAIVPTDDKIISAFVLGVVSFHLLLVSTLFLVLTGRFQKLLATLHVKPGGSPPQPPR